MLILCAAGGCQSTPGREIRANDPAPLHFSAPSGWLAETLPGAYPGADLIVLKRPALVDPVRFRVVVVPGSGCTGWLPLANRYFYGLLHAELLVLHKPHVDVNAGAGAGCTPEFIQADALSDWRDHAQAALRAHQRRLSMPELPQLLVGISEGAELLPGLASELPALAGVVMVSAPGLDPREAGALQARRLNQWPAWQSVEQAQSSQAGNDVIVQGRTLRYWRDFWRWQLAGPLLDAPWPLLRVWGDADAQVARAAYAQFSKQAVMRAAPFCDLVLPGADHGLQTGSHDGLQLLWARLEIWARSPDIGFCGQAAP